MVKREHSEPCLEINGCAPGHLQHHPDSGKEYLLYGVIYRQLVPIPWPVADDFWIARGFGPSAEPLASCHPHPHWQFAVGDSQICVLPSDYPHTIFYLACMSYDK